VKAISLTQPWATLVALGLKPHETRSWPTRHRGPLAIHAAKGFPPDARRFAADEQAAGRIGAQLPLGAVLCVVNVTDCLPPPAAATLITPRERSYGDYTPGRWAWLFSEVLQVFAPPIPARGALGLWDWNGHASPSYEITNPQLLLLDL